MDHELMAKLTKEAQEEEKRKFANAEAAVARLDKKQNVRVLHSFEASSLPLNCTYNSFKGPNLCT